MQRNSIAIYNAVFTNPRLSLFQAIDGNIWAHCTIIANITHVHIAFPFHRTYAHGYILNITRAKWFFWVAFVVDNRLYISLWRDRKKAACIAAVIMNVIDPVMYPGC